MYTPNHIASRTSSLSFTFEMLGFPNRLEKQLLLGSDHQSKPFKVRMLLPQKPRRYFLAGERALPQPVSRPACHGG